MKTFDAAQGHCDRPRKTTPSLREFEALLAHGERVSKATVHGATSGVIHL